MSSPVALDSPNLPDGISAQQLAYGVLLDGIVSGQLAPGDAIRPDDVAKGIGVSRMPVRDALRRLEGEGFVTLLANRSSRVRELMPDELLEYCEMRSVLEGLAARLAVPNVTEENVYELEYLERRMVRSESYFNDWLVRHDEFHNRLTELSGRPNLVAQVKRLRLIFRPYLRGYSILLRLRESGGLGHNDIMDCVRNREAEKIEAIVRGHVLEHADRIAELLASDDTREQLKRNIAAQEAG